MKGERGRNRAREIRMRAEKCCDRGRSERKRRVRRTQERERERRTREMEREVYILSSLFLFLYFL